jgi:biofilm PGA synthesis protein PgaA
LREQELTVAKRKILWHGAAAGLALLASAHDASAAGQAEYNAIIQSARAGEYSQAISALEKWSDPVPIAQQVNSDLTVILRWAGRDAEALTLAKKSGVSGLEPYALRSAAVAARNLQDAPWALAAYNRLVEIDSSDCDAKLGLALSLVDTRESTRAEVVMDALELSCTPVAGRYVRDIAQARSYWAARRLDVRVPQELLALAWWVEKLDAANPSSRLAKSYEGEALREAILLASKTGSHYLVRSWLDRGRPNLSGDETAQVLSAKAAQQIRWALVTPDEARAQWRTLLDSALVSLNQAKPLATEKSLRSAIASDTISAFSELGDDASIFREVDAADAAALQLLPYAEVAVADALMRANNPKAAEARLRAVLARLQGGGEFDQRDVSVGLYYALIDQGKFSQARQLINERAALVPAFANRNQPGVQTEDDGYVRFQLARSSLLSSSLDGRAFNTSRSLVSNLLRDAPFNTDIRLNDAEWFQARGFPRAASQVTRLVLADRPNNTRALDIAARQALDRGDFSGFEAYQQEIQASGAHPQMQERLRLAADRQMGFVFAGEAVRGTGVAADPSGGSSDREATLSLLSPIYQNRWRLKARWRSSDAQFGNAAPEARFFAVGARFYWPYFWAEAEAVKRTEGRSNSSSPGLRVAGQWQVVDGVSAFATLASRSEEFPLRGQAAGETANSAQLSVDWRVLPQSYVGIGLNGFNATDGNRQRGISFYADQAYTLADHWRANARFDISQATNSRNDVAYFSPRAADSFAVSGAIAQDLVTSGQIGWTHKLSLNVGEVSQRGFERAGSHSISYEHEWRLGGYRTLSTAIGESRRPYDGVQSRRKTFSLRWSLAL